MSRGDPASPELALVDPVLADQARAWLSDPGDTLERIERILRARRLAASRTERQHGPGSLEPRFEPAGSVPRGPSSRPRADRRAAVFAGSVATAVLVSALLIDVRVDVRGTPAGADTTEIAEPPPDSTPPAAVPKPPVPKRTVPKRTVPKPTVPKAPVRKAKSTARSSPESAVVPQRFVWAPDARASGYEVAFFRGAALVFSRSTKRAEVSIPASWSFAGRRLSLEPGEYRWYVWPIVGGRRASEAIVQAKLVVPPR